MVTRTLHKKPIAWPFKVLGWFVVLVFALALVVGATVVGAVTYYEMTRTKAGDLEAKIEEKLPTGATADQVITFLDAQGIEHTFVAPSQGNDEKLQQMGVPKGTMVIAATVRNEGYSVDLVDIEMRFILDQELKLTNYIVWEVHRRP